MLRSRLGSLLLVLALPLGCKSGDPSPEPTSSGEQADAVEGDSDRPKLFNPDPSPAAPKQLVPSFEGPSVGMQPGYLDGAFLFASARAGSMQDLLQSLPLEPSVARDLAELGQALGADPRVDDVLAHLGVDPNARTSLSIRPMIDHAAAVKQAIDEAGPLLDELDRSTVNEARTLSAAAELLLDQVETLGFHLRWHLPLDPTRGQKLISLFGQFEPGEWPEWSTTCATLPPSLLCTGESDVLIHVRQVPSGVQLDALIFFQSAHDESDTELRRTLAQQAVALPSAQAIPGVGSLRGDANLLISSTPAFNAMRAAELRRTISNLRWEGREVLAKYGERDAAMRALHDAARLFEGVQIEAKIDAQRIHANLAWLPTPLGKQKIAEMFELLQVDADVPSLAALCEGSLVCARSRGLPSTARFASLATGPFADPEQFEAAAEQTGEEPMAMLLALESWPNLIGMVAKFPGNSMSGSEAVVAENSKKAAERVLAFGFALRKLSVAYEREPNEWIGFARMPAMDLSTLRGIIRMGSQYQLQAVTLEGVPGSIEQAELPDQKFPGRFYSISDPQVATGSWGWAVLADGDERVRWMTGLPRDDGSAPIAYFEIRDLWGLFAGVDELAIDASYTQAWSSGRSLRAQWDHTPTGPELRMLLEKRP